MPYVGGRYMGLHSQRILAQAGFSGVFFAAKILRCELPRYWLPRPEFAANVIPCSAPLSVTQWPQWPHALVWFFRRLLILVLKSTAVLRCKLLFFMFFGFVFYQFHLSFSILYGIVGLFSIPPFFFLRRSRRWRSWWFRSWWVRGRFWRARRLPLRRPLDVRHLRRTSSSGMVTKEKSHMIY